MTVPVAFFLVRVSGVVACHVAGPFAISMFLHVALWDLVHGSTFFHVTAEYNVRCSFMLR